MTEDTAGPVNAQFLAGKGERGDFWTHFNEWAEKNAKPKQINYQKPTVEPTKYSKRGPMSQADWERFSQWVAEKGKPKTFPTLPTIKRVKVPLNKLMKRLKSLAKPRKVSPRYKMKKRSRGKFRCGKVDMKHLDKLAKPKICGRCPEVVFTVKQIPKAVLTYVPTPRIIQLSQPLTLPRPKHCDLPLKEEERVPPRIKMNHRQMQNHLIRLEYLAAPVRRPDPNVDEEYEPYRAKKPLNQLFPRIEVLAQPKPDFTPKPAPSKRKPLSALQGRLATLAKPRQSLQKKGGDPFKVKKSALRARATPRIEILAKPKPDFSEPPADQKKSKRRRSW